MQVVEEFGEGIFIAAGRVRFYGFSLTIRMAVIRLPGNDLLLYSPVYLSPELAADLASLGRVRHLVAPNKIHNLALDGYCDAYPEAALWLAPGLAERRPDLAPAGLLGKDPEPAWQEVLEQCLTGGNVFFSEVLMLHKPSRTLLVTDLVENIDATTASAPARAIGRLFGMKMRPAPSPEFLLYTLDAEAAQDALVRARQWSFDRIFLCHGGLVTEGAGEVFESVCEELIAAAAHRSAAFKSVMRRMAAWQ